MAATDAMTLTHATAAIANEGDLVAIARALGADSVPSTGRLDQRLPSAGAPRFGAHEVTALREQIADGADPLGDAFTRLRRPDQRRPLGATYTPAPIVEAMLRWTAAQGKPARVIDPGAGSGRFLLRAGRLFPAAQLLAVEIDPVAAYVARANLAAAGLSGRARVVVDDFRRLAPERIDGSTAYIGNPPYVRHHQIEPSWKSWLAATAALHQLSASKLAGLHVHFFLATASIAEVGDYGTYITASEWLDVNYGSLVRELLLSQLGGLAVHVLDPKSVPFSDAATTGAISCFRVGSQPTSLRMRRVETVKELGALDGGRLVKRERLAEAPRWSTLLRNSKPVPADHVELGELCRVHRGAVTGANGVWVTAAGDTRVPARFLRPSVTRAKELFSAGVSIDTDRDLRRVIDLPVDLDALDQEERRLVEKFKRWAKSQHADKGYIAKHRPNGAWWAIGMKAPAPILATYMARRPPAFVRNLADARHINVAHGLYPREPLPEKVLTRLALALRTTVSTTAGRTYAGGLTKFEPREMERLHVPSLEQLSA